MIAPDHRSRGWARALLLAAGLLAAGCERDARGPVAPFGGDLAAPLPYRDVLGFARLRIGDEVSDALASMASGATIAKRIGFFGPTAKVLEMLGSERTRFLAADEPFVIFLLDANVHGAFAAFAWRGDGGRFREAARAAGLRLDEDRVELPGRGRGSLSDLAVDAAAHAREEGDLRDEGQRLPAHVTYHVIEREGVTLLAPARDGARNLLATLQVTGALAPAVEAEVCVRLDVGRVMGKLRDNFRNTGSLQIDHAMEWLQERAGLRRPSNVSSYWAMRRNAFNLIDGSLDLACSVDHLFSRWQDGRLDLYLRAEPGGFFDRLLPIARNQPTKELVGGAPADALAMLAFSVDPKSVGDVPRRWRSTQRGWFRRMRHGAPFEEADSREEGTPFLASFAGRAWIAAATVAATEDEVAPSVAVRTFAAFSDEESDQSLLEAALDALLPREWMTAVRAASLFAFRHQRVAGGVIEAIGTEPGNVIAREARRLADPEPFPVPWDGPEEAFCFGRFIDPAERDPVTMTLTRDDHGVHAVFVLPTP